MAKKSSKSKVKKVAKKSPSKKPQPKKKVSRKKPAPKVGRAKTSARSRVYPQGLVARLVRALPFIHKRAPKSKRFRGRSLTFVQKGLWPLAGLVVVLALVGGLRASQRAELPEPVKTTEAVTALSPAPEVKAPEPPYSGPLAAEFSAARSKGLGERISFWSEYLAANPDSWKKLLAIPGTPSLEDTAPLVPEKFDCSTYVETVAALAKSDQAPSFFSNLLGIRYRDGRPTFGSRNHFPEADWIPNNAAAGNLADVTEEIAQGAGVAIGREGKVIDRAGWFVRNIKKNRVRALASVDQEYAGQPSEVRLPYIPVSELKRVLPRIPSGTVLNLVRRNNPRKEVLITHQGFVIQEGGRTLFRHARPPGRMRTDELWSYLQKLQKRPDYQSWPLLGVNLNRVK